MPDPEDRLRELCKRAMRENDPAKLMELVDKINEILASLHRDVDQVLQHLKRFH